MKLQGLPKGFLTILLALFVMSSLAYGQWETNGDDINNTNTGNVGIGTDDPQVKFEVVGVSAGTIMSRFANYGGGYGLIMRQHRGTVATPLQSSNSDGATILWQEYDGSNFQSTAQIQGESDGHAPTASDSRGRLILYTTPVGATTPTARMRITSAGNVGIGTGNPSAKLDISATGDGAEVLRLSTERAWTFRQSGVGGDAQLDLHATVDSKYFKITSVGGTRAAQFYASNTLAYNKVYLVPDGGRVGIGRRRTRSQNWP